MQTWVAQLRKGLVELAVLGVLREGEAYGYQILQRLNEVDGLAITESTVYPILARLSQDGLVKVRAAPSPSGPPRRYYNLTPLGRSRLREMTDHWQRIQTSLNGLLSSTPSPSGRG